MKYILKFIMLFLGILFVSCNLRKTESINEQKYETAFTKGEKINNNNFTGTAYSYIMVKPDSTYQVQVGNVTFEPGARTNWHKHPGGQILLITEGKGYYQENGKIAQFIKTGDVVKVPPNKQHWHGAAPDSKLTHITISPNINKGTVVWLHPVTDEDYNSAKR